MFTDSKHFLYTTNKYDNLIIHRYHYRYIVKKDHLLFSYLFSNVPISQYEKYYMSRKNITLRIKLTINEENQGLNRIFFQKEQTGDTTSELAYRNNYFFCLFTILYKQYKMCYFRITIFSIAIVSSSSRPNLISLKQIIAGDAWVA